LAFTVACVYGIGLTLWIALSLLTASFIVDPANWFSDQTGSFDCAFDDIN